jgi:hypothetical protein
MPPGRKSLGPGPKHALLAVVPPQLISKMKSRAPKSPETLCGQRRAAPRRCLINGLDVHTAAPFYSGHVTRRRQMRRFFRKAASTAAAGELPCALDSAGQRVFASIAPATEQRLLVGIVNRPGQARFKA